MALVGEAVAEIVDGDEVEIGVAVRIAVADATDCPVVVGRETVGKIIIRSEGALHHKGLMADEHPF